MSVTNTLHVGQSWDQFPVQTEELFMSRFSKASCKAPKHTSKKFCTHSYRLNDYDHRVKRIWNRKNWNHKRKEEQTAKGGKESVFNWILNWFKSSHMISVAKNLSSTQNHRGWPSAERMLKWVQVLQVNFGIYQKFSNRCFWKIYLWVSWTGLSARAGLRLPTSRSS